MAGTKSSKTSKTSKANITKTKTATSKTKTGTKTKSKTSTSSQKKKTQVKNSKLNGVRKVYFGLRVRFFAIFFIVMLLILSTMTFVMYMNQRKAVEEEKDAKATALTKILSGPAEYYLNDKENTTREEKVIKYKIIEKEADNFRKFNDDIYKILLFDENAKIRYSTYKFDIGKKYRYKYVVKCLDQKDASVDSYDFNLHGANYRVITYPIFIQKGKIADVLSDFKKNYREFYESDPKIKRKIYYSMWRQYKYHFDDSFNPSRYRYSNISDPVIKAWDIDFLYLKLFTDMMNSYNGKIKRSDRQFWNDKWLFELKNKRLEAYKSDNYDQIDKINKKINERMLYLHSQVNNAARLGLVAILFNLDKTNEDLNKSVIVIIYIAAIMFIISLIIFLFLIKPIMKNLKDLESWALMISEGNIDVKIRIRTKDEIGRLSDVFNNMLDEIKVKFHLEKFVSRSTKSMIERRQDSGSAVGVGRTAKKNYAFLFSDVRGFTTFSENNEPETVIELLNMYFDIQARIIKAKKGDIDAYVGDEIIAHFGGEKKADTGISVALEIIQEINKFNEDRKKNNLPFFEVGIGLHGGNVVVGNIGSRFRMDYSCIGDVVNLASRLCSNAKPGEILVSDELFSQVESRARYKIKKIPAISVKGKAKKIKVVKLMP